MLVAIIEFEMNPGTQEEFSGLIGGLQSQVETIDGFISADPAASLNNDGMMYEISYWRDAEALAAWAMPRSTSTHSARSMTRGTASSGKGRSPWGTNCGFSCRTSRSGPILPNSAPFREL